MSFVDDYCIFFLSPSLLAHSLLLPLLLLAAASAFVLHPGGLAWALSLSKTRRLASGPTIPGPAGLPGLGLVFAFTGPLAHRVLSSLAKASDALALMAFSIGSTRFLISSQPDTAKEILGSSAFADRPVKESAYELLFHRAMGFAPYGEYWRNLRRISATHLFSPLRVARFGGFRREIGRKMVEEVKGLMSQNGVVEVYKVLHFGSLNNVMMSVFGKTYEFVGSNNKEGEELEGLVNEGYKLLGMFNWSDHFPLLGRLDLQGVRKRCKSLVDKVNVFVGIILDEHKTRRRLGNEFSALQKEEIESSKDFVDVLLDLDGENKLTQSDMVAVLWEMIFRGTDTIAILLEWILARMVMHPDIQAKAQTEIDIITKGRDVQDSDLANLPYLNAIIKETLRMHPPGPLLSWARLSIEDTHVGHHFVPAGTTAMVNMWAITHDPSIWPEPDKFNPERFITKDVSIMGSDLTLAPFGAGRRVCPGKAMGLVTVQLWLAQMLQNFNWVAGETGVDLSEILNLSLEMKNHLICKAVSRNVWVGA